MSIRDQFAKPDEVRQGSNEKTPIFSLKDGESMVVRIFPAMKDMRQKHGVDGFAAYHTVHYGFKTRDKNDPTKTRDASIVCIERKDSSGKTTISCPLDRLYEARQQEYGDKVNAAIAKYMASGVGNMDAKVKAEEEYAELKNWLSEHRADKRAYMYVLRDTGELGILKVPQSLVYGDPEKKKYSKTHGVAYHRRKLVEQYGVDLLDIEHGVQMRFTRKGSGFTSSYTVEPVLEKSIINGRAVTTPKEQALTDEQLERAYAGPSLSALPWLRRVTTEQMRMLAESSGDPEEVEMILNLATKVEASPPPEVTVTAPVVAQTRTVATQKTEMQILAEESVDSDDLDAQIEALRLKKAARNQTKTAKATPSPVVTDEEEVDDEEFMRRFGNK